MSLIARRGLMLSLAVFCGVVVLTAAMSQAAGPPPGVAGEETSTRTPTVTATATPTPIPCTNGPCRMSLVITQPAGACDGEETCTIGLGQKFTLAVDLRSVPAPGYILAQSWIDFGDDLFYDQAAHTPAEEIVWEDCEDLTALRVTLSEAVSHGCITGLFPPPASTYHGLFVEISLQCSTFESENHVWLRPRDHPIAGTSGAVYISAGVFEPGEGGGQIVPEVDSLTVNCGVPDPPTPGGPDTATPTDTPTGTLTPATATPSPTTTPTGTLTPATATPTPTETPTGTLTPATATPSVTVTATASGTPAPPANTPTSTPMPTNTPTQRPSLLGDVNCDISVDPVDATFILQWAAGLIDELPCPDAGDADGDGETTVIDAAVILQFSAGLVSSLPP